MGFITKTVEKWQKAVSDWKSKVRAKAADINKGLVQTGGGGAIPPLNDNEKRLMAILGWSGVSGTSNVELGLGTGKLSTKKEDKINVDAANTSTSAYSTAVCSAVSISPPPLFYVGKENLQTCTEDPESQDNKAQSESQSKLLKQQVLPKTSVTRRLQSDTTPRRRITTPSNNLQLMHEETLTVLKEINANIEKLANSQERLAGVIERLLLHVTDKLDK